MLKNYDFILGASGTIEDQHLKSFEILEKSNIKKFVLIPSMFDK